MQKLLEYNVKSLSGSDKDRNKPVAGAGFASKLDLMKKSRGHWHFVDVDKGDSKTNGVIMG